MPAQQPSVLVPGIRVSISQACQSLSVSNHFSCSEYQSRRYLYPQSLLDVIPSEERYCGSIGHECARNEWMIPG
eukprot:762564-Hanusia_phi.AAC.2